MNKEHFMIISLEDSKSKVIAEVLGSKTCKKIISYLAEVNEASEKDLSDKLNIPLNTIEYNLKKAVESGFVQKKNKFFWSKKGKKIAVYELANKTIVLSSKRSNLEKIKSVIPTLIFTAVGTISLAFYEKLNSFNTLTQDSLQTISTESMKISKGLPNLLGNEFITNNVVQSTNFSYLWLYFLVGSLLAVFIITLMNWRRL